MVTASFFGFFVKFWNYCHVYLIRKVLDNYLVSLFLRIVYIALVPSDFLKAQERKEYFRFSVSDLVMDFFVFLSFLGSVLLTCIFLENYPFHQDFQNHLHKFVQSSFIFEIVFCFDGYFFLALSNFFSFTPCYVICLKNFSFLLPSLLAFILILTVNMFIEKRLRKFGRSTNNRMQISESIHHPEIGIVNSWVTVHMLVYI